MYKSYKIPDEKVYQNNMQIRKEKSMNYKPQNHLWPLSRGHHINGGYK